MTPPTAESALTGHLKVAVETLISTSERMTKSIVDTQEKILSAYIDKAASRNPANEIEVKSNDPKSEVSRLLVNEKYEQAFDTALSASNLDLVTWLCSQVNPGVVFSSTPPVLSQAVLLSLMQQLGVDLTRDTAMKLHWLREAALALNPPDVLVQNHGPAVLSILLHNLEENFPKFAKHHNPCAKDFKVLMHLINSIKTEISAANE
eukprot:TRINITY_DN1146_c0_g2_i1.p1 TRINITY_DN1146_c0_g2~~TRINITY_DN1146_c0_g2_i1.p1  ORF type:complete len:206 (-),score=54.22 TRINITY_DN1146_c0_g2_i1:189-806(-)